jgi:hypothetical protein
MANEIDLHVGLLPHFMFKIKFQDSAVLRFFGG